MEDSFEAGETRKLTNERNRKIFIVSLLNSWLSKKKDYFDFESVNAFLIILETAINKITIIESDTIILIPALLYGDKYVKSKQKLFKKKQVFGILMISLLLSIKFWIDGNIHLMNASIAFELPKQLIIDLELEVLKNVDWNLFISEKDIENYNLKALWSHIF